MLIQAPKGSNFLIRTNVNKSNEWGHSQLNHELIVDAPKQHSSDQCIDVHLLGKDFDEVDSDKNIDESLVGYQ